MFGWLQSTKETVADASTCSPHESGLFVSAAGSGNLDEVNKGLANKTVWRDFQDKYEQSALMRAANGGHVAVINRLLQSGVNKDLQEKRGSTALMLASSSGHQEAVRLLLQAKANRDLRDGSGRTAMIIAVERGHAQIVQDFITAGWNKDAPDQVLSNTYKGWTPLMHAVRQVQVASVETLLRANANVDAQSAVGTTALMVAAYAGHSSTQVLTVNNIIQTLLKAGANVNKQDNVGYTALIYASKNLRGTMIDFLIQAGADVSLKGKDGKAAIDFANTPQGKAQFAPKSVPAPAAIPAATATVPAKAPAPGAAAAAASAPSVNKAVTAVPAPVPVPVPAPKAAVAPPVAPAATVAAVTPVVPVANATKPLTIGVGPAPAATPVQAPKAVVTPVSVATVPPPAAKPVVTSMSTPAPVVPKPAAAASSTIVPAAPAPLKAPAPPVSVPAPAPVPVAAAKPAAAPLVVAPLVAAIPVTKSAAVPTPPATVRAVVAAATPNTHGAPVETAIPAEFTEQDRVALQTLAQTSAQSLMVHGRLNEVMLTVAAHDRTLQLLVSKQKECPSLFWFYPKKRELRNWLSNPAKCLFQDTLMMVVVCPVTLCVVQCGPKGVGWEVSMPKEWVKKWGPAIMFSIYVMQAAVLAGRVVGIPLPQLPSAANITGLSSTVLGVGVNDVVNRQNMMKCLTEFASTTATVLGQQNREMQAITDSIQQQGKNGVSVAGQQVPLAEAQVKQVTDDAYKSIHTFLTTGDNAKLGKLEDQLRGRIERVMAPNGDVDWVSVEGRAMWLEKRKLIGLQVPAAPVALAATPAPAAVVTPTQVVVNTKPAAASVSEKPAPPSVMVCNSWLAVRLRTAGIDDGHIQDCEQKLVKGEGFASEVRFAAMTSAEFDVVYLKSIGITPRGLQMELVALHAELRTQHHPIVVTPPSPALAPAAAPQIPPQPLHSSATFTSEEKSAVLQMQSTIQDLTSQLSKLRASSATASTAAPNTSSRNGHVSVGSGQVLQQAQATANAINPRTRLPYTMDDLSEEILRLQRELAQTNRDIGNVAATTEEKFENLQPAVRASKPFVPFVPPAKKKGWFY